MALSDTLDLHGDQGVIVTNPTFHVRKLRLREVDGYAALTQLGNS